MRSCFVLLQVDTRLSQHHWLEDPSFPTAPPSRSAGISRGCAGSSRTRFWPQIAGPPSAGPSGHYCCCVVSFGVGACETLHRDLLSQYFACSGPLNFFLWIVGRLVSSCTSAGGVCCGLVAPGDRSGECCPLGDAASSSLYAQGVFLLAYVVFDFSQWRFLIFST